MKMPIFTRVKRINLTKSAVLLAWLWLLTLGPGCELLPSIDFSAPAPAPAPTQAAPPAQPRTPVETATATPAPINPAYTVPPPATVAPPPAPAIAPALPNIADVVARVRPSVVAINTEVVSYDIFRRPITQKGAGSGWIIDKNGLVVTNNHVVEGAKTVTVTLDSKSYTAELVRTDPVSDLAIVKINTSGLPAVQVGDSSKLRVGDWVIAIGNALGRGISATEGIISRTGVSVDVDQGQTLYDLLGTSAAINPGNSGGPLVNMAGEVIGITSAKLAAIGVEGMGYAISINTAKPIIETLIQKGYVTRPWLGIGASSVTEWLVARYSLAVNKGSFLTQVVPNSPADKAGLKLGDVVVQYGDKEVTTSDELVRAIQTSQIGQQVQITYWRGKNKSVATATLVESPNR